MASLLLVALNGLGNYLQLRSLNRTSIFVVFAAYLFMAWALANHRVFNARHVLAAVGHRLVVVGVLAASAWGLSAQLGQLMPTSGAWVVAIVLCGTAVFWLDQKTLFWMGLGDERVLAALRSEIIQVSRQEAGTGRLTDLFEQLLTNHHQASFAVILSQQGDKYAGTGIEFPSNRSGLTALCNGAWITPESLLRRRATPSLENLGAFLQRHSLGVIVAVPRGSPSPSMLVAVGTKRNEWPFTYPEVRRLQNVAELMDSILTRSRLTDQAAMRARMEHLAMMTRGLAHDLKNLITPVASFLVYTDGRHPGGSAEAEVHAAARRSVRIMTEYLREALFFSERLEPKFEGIELDRIFQRVAETTAARAAARGVLLSTTQECREPVTADGVLLLRMLTNLVGNAIDASSSGQTVMLCGRSGRVGWLQLEVIDQGCGIAPEAIDRIFDPYFTTKEFGEEVRGFGLGLTISQKIVHLHRGSIGVRSKLGHGTTLTVEIPLDPAKEATGPDTAEPKSSAS